jgi:hypothetical protein
MIRTRFTQLAEVVTSISADAEAIVRDRLLSLLQS